MGIHLRWDDESRTRVIWEFDRTWNWKDYFAAQEQHMKLAAEVDYPVDAIVDMRESVSLPSGVPTQFKRIAQAYNADSYSVLVGVSRFVSIMFDLFARVQPETARKILTAKSMDEARALLREKRGTLSP